MNTHRDPEAVLAAWLDDGPLELPAETRQSIAVGIRTVTRRRSGIDWPFGRLDLPSIDLRRLSVALGSAAVVLVAATLALNYVFNQLGGPPGGDPRRPFVGTWVSTDTDGSTQTMKVSAPRIDAIEITLLDDAATVCSGAPATMTGTGHLEGTAKLVIPRPVVTCDDGSEPPLQELLRDKTFVYNPESDTLTEDLGTVWVRKGADATEPAAPILNSIEVHRL